MHVYAVRRSLVGSVLDVDPSSNTRPEIKSKI